MRTLKSKLAILILLASFGKINGQATGEIRGKVINKDNKAPVEFATVVVYMNDEVMGSSYSDEKGYFTLKPLLAGQYVLKASVMGHAPFTMNNIEVNAQSMTRVNVEMVEEGIIIDGGTVTEYEIPLISPTGSGTVISEKDIDVMPYTSPQDIAATGTGIIQSDSGEGLNIRGSREDGTQYIIDGMKVIGAFNLPKNAIKEVKVLTGGVPAMFGDATGGIIVITTKGFTNW